MLMYYNVHSVRRDERLRDRRSRSTSWTEEAHGLCTILVFYRQPGLEDVHGVWTLNSVVLPRRRPVDLPFKVEHQWSGLLVEEMGIVCFSDEP